MRAELGAVGLVLVAALSIPARAAEMRSDETLVTSETIDDDLYVSGGSVTVSGPVHGDLVATGGNVVVSGPVDGDVLAFAGNTTVQGPVGGSIRGTGGTLIVTSDVAEDVAFVGGNLTVAPDARVGRDLLAAGGSVDIDGAVAEDATTTAGAVGLGGFVGGDLFAQTGSLDISPEAVIGGDVVQEEGEAAPPGPGAAVLGWVRMLVGLFVLGALFVWMFPGWVGGSLGALRQRPWTSFGSGALVAIGAPLVAAGVFVLGLVLGGWWLGVMLLALWSIAVALGTLVASLLVGRLVLERVGRGDGPPVPAMLLGLILLLLLGAIPVLGPVVLTIAMLFGLGALAIAAVRRHEAREPFTPA